MVRRSRTVAFMAGAHVFPGGRVEEHDREGDSSWCDGVAGASARIPDVASGDAIAFRLAAIRELFEEVGILLARNAQDALCSLSDGDTQVRFGQHRADIHSGRRSLREVLLQERLRPALDLVIPYAHWVTPPLEIRRFDTRFFIARAPEHQSPVHDNEENIESRWITAADALAAARSGDIVLPPPTWATLRELEPFQTVGEALAWAAVRTIRRREPRLEDDGVLRQILLPGDPQHPDADPVEYETRFVWRNDRWRAEPVA